MANNYCLHMPALTIICNIMKNTAHDELESSPTSFAEED